jgi:hypothetical protein
MGIATKVVLMKVSLPLWFVMFLFQVGSLLAILSTSDSRADLGSFVTNKGMLRYFNGKLTTRQGNKEDTKVTYSSMHRIGAIWHLLRLQPR